MDQEVKLTRIKHPTLTAALCAVMQDVENIKKNGKNSFHGYQYATEADVLRAVQPAFAMHGIALIPQSAIVTRTDGPATSKGKSQWITTIEVTYRLCHADSAEERDVIGVGCGIDGEDKGVYKAQTGALKYALRQLLLIPTGDDPDDDKRDGDRDRDRAGGGNQTGGKREPPPATKSAAPDRALPAPGSPEHAAAWAHALSAAAKRARISVTGQDVDRVWDPKWPPPAKLHPDRMAGAAAEVVRRLSDPENY